MPTKIEISFKTIFQIFVFLFTLYFLYTIKSVLMQLLIAVIIMVAINPTVIRIQKINIFGYKSNRVSATLLAYLFYLTILSIFITLVIQPLAKEAGSFISKIPLYANQFSYLYPLDGQGITQILNQFGSLTNSLFGFITGLFSNAITILTTLVISFYLVIERPRLHDTLAYFLGNKNLSDQINELITTIEHQLGGWVRAQLFLMIIVGVLSYIGFTILQLPNALSLAIIAGFLELIPNIGPTITMIPVAIAGFSVSIWHGVGALCWCFIVQWLENNLIVPQVMSKSTGVPPIITIVSLIIGFTLAGVAGAVLAVPMAIVIRILLETFVYSKKHLSA